MTPASHFGSVQSTHLDCGISADDIHIRRHTKKPRQTGQIHGSSLNLKEQGINLPSGIKFLLFLGRIQSPASSHSPRIIIIMILKSMDCTSLHAPVIILPRVKDVNRASCQESWDWLKQPSDFQCRKRAARRCRNGWIFTSVVTGPPANKLFFFFWPIWPAIIRRADASVSPDSCLSFVSHFCSHDKT